MKTGDTMENSKIKVDWVHYVGAGELPWDGELWTAEEVIAELDENAGGEHAFVRYDEDKCAMTVHYSDGYGDDGEEA